VLTFDQSLVSPRVLAPDACCFRVLLLNAIIPFYMKHNAEVDACDLLMEVRVPSVCFPCCPHVVSIAVLSHSAAAFTGGYAA